MTALTVSLSAGANLERRKELKPRQRPRRGRQARVETRDPSTPAARVALASTRTAAPLGDPGYAKIPRKLKELLTAAHWLRERGGRSPITKPCTSAACPARRKTNVHETPFIDGVPSVPGQTSKSRRSRVLQELGPSSRRPGCDCSTFRRTWCTGNETLHVL